MKLENYHFSERTDSDSMRCDYCGAVASVVWVHGHGQCTHCGINVEECCRGEQCDPSVK